MGCFEEENEEGIHLRDRNEADERSELMTILLIILKQVVGTNRASYHFHIHLSLMTYALTPQYRSTRHQKYPPKVVLKVIKKRTKKYIRTAIFQQHFLEP